MNRPTCFVLMPFGKKPDFAGGMIDFDVVYIDLMVPINEVARSKQRRSSLTPFQGSACISSIQFNRIDR